MGHGKSDPLRSHYHYPLPLLPLHRNVYKLKHPRSLINLFDHHISLEKYERPPRIFQKSPSTEVHYSHRPNVAGKFRHVVITPRRNLDK